MPAPLFCALFWISDVFSCALPGSWYRGLNLSCTAADGRYRSCLISEHHVAWRDEAIERRIGGGGGQLALMLARAVPSAGSGAARRRPPRPRPGHPWPPARLLAPLMTRRPTTWPPEAMRSSFENEC